MKKAETGDFESSLAALERIVRELERGDLPLERSLVLFEQGVKLSRQCQERLQQAERRIEVLLMDNEGRPVISEAFGEDESRVRAGLDAGPGEAEEDESVF